MVVMIVIHRLKFKMYTKQNENGKHFYLNYIISYIYLYETWTEGSSPFACCDVRSGLWSMISFVEHYKLPKQQAMKHGSHYPSHFFFCRFLFNFSNGWCKSRVIFFSSLFMRISNRGRSRENEYEKTHWFPCIFGRQYGIWFSLTLALALADSMFYKCMYMLSNVQFAVRLMNSEFVHERVQIVIIF